MSFPTEVIIGGQVYFLQPGPEQFEMLERTRREAEASRDAQLRAQGLQPPPAVPDALSLSADAADPSTIEGSRKLAERWRDQQLVARGFQP